VRPALGTDPVADDPDDPAVWINPAEPAASLIIATNKVSAPGGALVVFGLDGKTRQTIADIDRPNNVDVEYGLQAGSARIDIAVTTERNKSRLRVFRVTAAGLQDISGLEGLPVFASEAADRAAPMGIALYKRPRDGAIFAIVGRKTGPKQGYLWQYRLTANGEGVVGATKVREFGSFSGVGEIEAIAVDDELGYVYYADEGDGIHKWHADPDHPEAGRELAHFGKTGFRGDREGIAIYTLKNGTGYIVCTDQVPGNSEYHVFSREGTRGNSHEHREIKIFRGGADETDGIEIVSAPLGNLFPHGLMIAMNSTPKNFLVYKWKDIAEAGTPKLQRR
jgi:3-phytase